MTRQRRLLVLLTLALAALGSAAPTADEVKAKYKTFDKYLAAIGVSKADTQQLRQELLAG